MQGDIDKAVTILNHGGIVIFPTDTAFGVGCRIDDEKAVERLFALRKRPPIQPAPVLVSSVEMAQDYLLPIPRRVRKQLIENYWPGALTLVLYCTLVKVPELVRGGGETLGVRMPDHPVVLEIIKKVGVPILGPSANFHGGKTPYTFDELDQKLVKEVDFVVKGECKVKQASTVVDCTKEPWVILRDGAVKVRRN